MMEHDKDLESDQQQSREIDAQLLSGARQVICLWIPSEDGADLVELLEPRGEGPTAGSIGLGFLGYGVDCDPDVLRAQMAAHDAGDVGRLPSTGPHFLYLAA
jgi:hypothetical protein